MKVLLAVFLFVTIASAGKPGGPKCVNDCIEEYPDVPIKIPICSTWNTDHIVQPDVLTKNCYAGCQLAILYPGTCKCPLNCHINTNQGRCSNNGCVCSEKWTGPSCSISKVPENSKLNLKQLPFGDIFGDHYWSKKELYKDDHPVFNTTRLASVYIKMSEYDLIHLLNATNMFNNTWLRSDILFDNGIIKQSLKDIGIRLKGSGGRMQRKKGFKLSFTSFGNSGRRFFELRRIGFKGQQENLTGAKSFITSELYRSMSVPVQRGSFAKVFINNVFRGLYWMGEELEKEYFASRYKGGKGNLYRCFIAGFEYLGDQQDSYKMLNLTFGGRVRRYYEKKLGDPEDYSDLVRFITVLNKTSDEEFPTEIQKIFEVEKYLRQLIVEIASANFDGYTVNHNNYMIYNDSKTKKFNFVSYDFDLTYWNSNLSTINVYEWHHVSIPFPPFIIRPAPLTVRIMKVPEFRRKFTHMFHAFLRRVLNPENGLIQRLMTIHDSLKGVAEKDLFYPLDYFVEERNMESWSNGFKNWEEFIESRFTSALEQLDKI